jgi:hypothetical protein
MMRASSLHRIEAAALRMVRRSQLILPVVSSRCLSTTHTAHRSNDDHSRTTSSSATTGSFVTWFGAAAVIGTLTLSALSDDPAHAEFDNNRRSSSGGSTPRGLGDALSNAAAAGDLIRLKQLLDRYKPRHGVNVPHRFGWTPLHAAAANGHKDVVAFLLSRPEIDVNARDVYSPDENDPFLRSVQFSARHQSFPNVNAEMAAFDPDEGEKFGYTPLHYAALFAPIEIVNMLLAAGADPELRAHGYAPGEIDLSRLPDDAPEKGRLNDTVARLEAERERKKVERDRQEKEDRLRFPLELKLSKEMIAQEVPILSVASAMRRRENGWSDPTKPLVFLFLGSSGVGQMDIHSGLIRINALCWQSFITLIVFGCMILPGSVSLHICVCR